MEQETGANARDEENERKIERLRQIEREIYFYKKR